MIDFVEISKECVDKFKASLREEGEEYADTLYVAISENGQVDCAYEPTILDDAYQCFLIHSRRELAVSNWYRWYKAEFINSKGRNLGEIIGNDCSMKIDWQGSWSNQVFELFHRDEVIYSCNPPFERHMQGIWDAYCKTLSSRQDEIEALKKELAQKNVRLHELEEQVDHFKEMLEEIHGIVKELEGE